MVIRMGPHWTYVRRHKQGQNSIGLDKTTANKQQLALAEKWKANGERIKWLKRMSQLSIRMRMTGLCHAEKLACKQQDKLCRLQAELTLDGGYPVWHSLLIYANGVSRMSKLSMWKIGIERILFFLTCFYFIHPQYTPCRRARNIRLFSNGTVITIVKYRLNPLYVRLFPLVQLCCFPSLHRFRGK